MPPKIFIITSDAPVKTIALRHGWRDAKRDKTGEIGEQSLANRVLRRVGCR
jgi:hypothetical protein